MSKSKLTVNQKYDSIISRNLLTKINRKHILNFMRKENFFK